MAMAIYIKSSFSTLLTFSFETAGFELLCSRREIVLKRCGVF